MIGLRRSADYESYRYMYADDGVVDAHTLNAGDTFSADLHGIKNVTSLALQAGGYATEQFETETPTPGTETQTVNIDKRHRVIFYKGKIEAGPMSVLYPTRMEWLRISGRLSAMMGGELVNCTQENGNLEFRPALFCEQYFRCEPPFG